MKRVRAIGWLAIAVLVLVFVLVAYGARGPDIALSATQHDFGDIEQGQVAVTEITVSNMGAGDLKIESVSTSCGCTSARVEPTVIPPGGEGKLIIRYDSGVHPDNGRIRRYIYIASNDPDEPEAQVIVTANVQAPAP